MDIKFDYLKTGYTRLDSITKYKHITNKEVLLNELKETKRNIELYNGWYKYKKEFFYIKFLDEVLGLIKELLGEEVSTYMGIPTIHYNLVEKRNKIGVVSKDFRDLSNNYIRSDLLTLEQKSNIYDILTKDNNSNDQEYKRLLTLYLFSNYYISLRDRIWNSLAIVNENGFDMAPTHDYESAFEIVEQLYYHDPLISFTFDEENMQELLKNNEFAKEAIDKISDINLLSLLLKIEKKYDILIPQSIKKHFIDFNNNKKEFMKEYKII